MDKPELSYYQRIAREHRGTTRQVGWGSEKSQGLRFAAIAHVLDGLLGERWRGLRVVDFGCGRGDLLTYLRTERGFRGAYAGVDAIEESIADAKAAHTGDPAAAFVLRNYDGAGPLVDEPFDIVLANGPFGITPAAVRDRLVPALLSQARVGMVATFLRFSRRVPGFEPENVLTEPTDILKLCDASEYRFRIHADYLPHDFTWGAARWE